MIDLNKIEDAAKAAPEGEWRYEPTGQTVWSSKKYMVADIRGWGHLQYLPNGAELQDATGLHIATANPATVLEMVQMIRERDSLLMKSLEVLSKIRCDSLYEQDCAVCNVEELLRDALSKSVII